MNMSDKPRRLQYDHDPLEDRKLILPCPVGEVSDGFHTFHELYDHRQNLFVVLMNSYPDLSWKSRLHEDGTMYAGDWFIAGMHLPTGDVSYHLEGRFWDMARVKALDRAPAWDGHTPEDVLVRLASWQPGGKPGAVEDAER
jgi:hypothetical protein